MEYALSDSLPGQGLLVMVYKVHVLCGGYKWLFAWISPFHTEDCRNSVLSTCLAEEVFGLVSGLGLVTQEDFFPCFPSSVVLLYQLINE